jgi:hypothetical protein
MNNDLGTISAGELLVRVAPCFRALKKVSKRKLAMTLEAISLYLDQIAADLLLGNLPQQTLVLLRAKTLTFIILAREIVSEQTAREIAQHLVAGTRRLERANKRADLTFLASDYERASNVFGRISNLLSQ